MARHLIIAGHGNQRNGSFDPGATGFIRQGEHKYVRDLLFPAMKRHLPKNADVVFYDALKVSNYGNLAQVAAQYKADEVTEIHFDATGTSAASGGHVIIHSDYKADGVDLALRDAINSMVGVRYTHRGDKGISGRSNLWNVNDARNRGITYRLIELGFGTNKRDADIMVGQVDQYGKALVNALFGGSASKPAAPSKPATANKPATKPSTSKKYTSIVDYLNANKINSSFNNRAKLARQHGISNYSGTAAQNTQLLNAMQGGASTGRSIDDMARSIINNKNAPNGHAARQKWLGVSNSVYQKVRNRVNQLM